jgi:hypothetical protein
MKKDFMLFLLIISLIHISSSSFIANKLLRHKQELKNYTYLVFDLEWPASVCIFNDCNKKYFDDQKV